MYDQPRDWTMPEDNVLRAGVKAGRSFGLISRDMWQQCGTERSRNACIGRANRIGLLDGRPKRQKPIVSKQRVFNRDDHRGHSSVEKINFVRRHAINGTAPSSHPPEEIPIASEFLSIPFLDLKEGMCRYPQGEGLGMLFCGQPQQEGSSYCPHCYRITHAPVRTLDISDAERERRRRQALRNNEVRQRTRAA